MKTEKMPAIIATKTTDEWTDEEWTNFNFMSSADTVKQS